MMPSEFSKIQNNISFLPGGVILTDVFLVDIRKLLDSYTLESICSLRSEGRKLVCRSLKYIPIDCQGLKAQVDARERLIRIFASGLCANRHTGEKRFLIEYVSAPVEFSGDHRPGNLLKAYDRLLSDSKTTIMACFDSPKEGGIMFDPASGAAITRTLEGTQESEETYFTLHLPRSLDGTWKAYPICIAKPYWSPVTLDVTAGIMILQWGDFDIYRIV